ncbi:hypothetical protein KXD40_003547 [Peronospora effusa]|nr:hypothetical protein KXD40_003547 [Peronospora effusa]CAI5725157.1 unnamed protein product [Peronospora effusa]
MRELVSKAKEMERRMLPRDAAAKERDRLDQLEKIAQEQEGQEEIQKGQNCSYHDAATNADLTDVYAVENRFAADAGKDKVDEDADDDDVDEELDESECENPRQNL